MLYHWKHFAGAPGSILGWGVCDFFPFLPKLHFQFPFLLSLPLPSLWPFACAEVYFILPWPKKKNSDSQDTHEVDLPPNHVISCNINFGWYIGATRARNHRSHRCPTEVNITWSGGRSTSWISWLNDFFGQGSTCTFVMFVFLQCWLNQRSYSKVVRRRTSA